MNNSPPKWLLIVSGLLAALGLFVGLSLYITPGTFIEDVDFSSIGSRYLASMWAARQIAIAAIIGFSVFKKSAVMLKISLSAYCLMNIQDVGIGIWIHDSGLAIGASVFSLISASMVVVLSRSASTSP